MNTVHRKLDLESVRQNASALTDSLRATLHEKLVMVALYGSAARGDFEGDHSDVNMLFVVESADPSVLDTMADPLQQAGFEFRCAPFVLTREELTRAADVFAAKFYEIRKSYLLLCGSDLLADLHFDPRELRHACEHELRNITLKIRRAYLTHRLDASQVSLILHRFVPQFLAVAKVVADQNHTGESTLAQTIESLAAEFHMEASTLRTAIEVRNHPQAPWPRVREACTTLLRALDNVSRAVDQWPCT